MIRLLVGSATIVAAHRAGKQSAFASEFSGSRLRGGGFPFSPHIAARPLRRVPWGGEGSRRPDASRTAQNPSVKLRSQAAALQESCAKMMAKYLAG